MKSLNILWVWLKRFTLWLKLFVFISRLHAARNATFDRNPLIWRVRDDFSDFFIQAALLMSVALFSKKTGGQDPVHLPNKHLRIGCVWSRNLIGNDLIVWCIQGEERVSPTVWPEAPLAGDQVVNLTSWQGSSWLLEYKALSLFWAYILSCCNTHTYPTNAIYIGYKKSTHPFQNGRF